MKNDSVMLGRIQSCEFGYGGYQGVMLGVSFQFGGNGWGVCDHWGFWATEHTSSCKWSEQDCKNYFGDLVLRIGKILREAKVDHVSKLKGIPVEVTFDAPDGKLLSWRVLAEVL